MVIILENKIAYAIKVSTLNKLGTPLPHVIKFRGSTFHISYKDDSGHVFYTPSLPQTIDEDNTIKLGDTREIGCF